MMYNQFDIPVHLILLGQLPYHILFIIISSLAFIETKKSYFYNQYESFFRITGLFIILIFMGFKYHVGGDWGTYLNTFNDIASNKKILMGISDDIGWYFLNYFIIKLNLSFVFLNLISAIIFLIGIHVNAKLYQNYWLFYLVLLPYFIFIVGMGYTRQTISIGLLLISISFLLKESNYKTFIISIMLILIGTLFHKSVFIFIVLPFFIMRFEILKIGIIVLSMYLLFITTFFLFLDESLFRRLTYFFQSSYSSYGAYLRVLILVLLAIFNLSIINVFENDLLKKRYNKNFSILLVIISFLILLSPSTVIIDRILLYFYILFASSLLTLYGYSKNQYNKNFILNFSIFFGFVFCIIWFNFADNAFSWVPYKNYLFMVF